MNSEPFATQLLETMTSAMLVLDNKLTILYLNPAAEAMLDTSGTRAVGEQFDSLFLHDFELLRDREQSSQDFSPFMRRSMELHIASGRTITVDLALTLFGHSEQLLIELQSLDRLLKISRDETLQSSQTTTRTMIRGMAHEIKNPLGGIRGAAQLLEKELDDPMLKDYTSVIIEEADRLRNLVDRMLGPRHASVMRSISIHEVLERVRILVLAESERPLHIQRDYDPSIPNMIGDVEQLIQAVLNIVRNAMQSLSSMDNEHQGLIIIRTRIVRQFTIGKLRHKLALQIDITDNGPGIDPKLMEAIFFPMVSGRAEGSGLGLSISQSIVHQHQGLIKCSSKPGSTTFSLFLPLEPIDEQL